VEFTLLELPLIALSASGEFVFPTQSRFGLESVHVWLLDIGLNVMIDFDQCVCTVMYVAKR
jgi:hypothetical protein